MNPECVECGEEYNRKRYALGYHTCLECGDIEAAKQIYAASPIKKIRSRATRMIPAPSARLTNLDKY